MKIIPDYAMINTDEQSVIVKKGVGNAQNGVVLPNEQAVYLWEFLVNNPCNKEQLLHALLEKYDISTVLALNYIDMFLKPLIEKGIIET